MSSPLLPVDWTNAVIIPAILGSLLAIWTGVLLARWVAFDTARMRAVEVLAGIANLPDCPSSKAYDLALEDIITKLLWLKAEMIRLKQVPAVHVLQYIFIRLKQRPWDYPPPQQAWPLPEGERQLMLARIQPYGMAWPQMLFDTGPSYWALLAIRRRVTSRYKILPCNYQAQLTHENAAIAQIGRQMEERRREVEAANARNP